MPAIRPVNMPRMAMRIPTQAIIQMTATRAMYVLVTHVEMSDSSGTSTFPMLRPILNLRSYRGRLRRNRCRLGLDALPSAWTVVRYARNRRISIILATLSRTLANLSSRVAIDILGKRTTFPIDYGGTRNLSTDIFGA
jgi:hypothetical protein